MLCRRADEGPLQVPDCRYLSVRTVIVDDAMQSDGDYRRH